MDSEHPALLATTTWTSLVLAATQWRSLRPLTLLQRHTPRPLLVSFLSISCPSNPDNKPVCAQSPVSMPGFLCFCRGEPAWPEKWPPTVHSLPHLRCRALYHHHPCPTHLCIAAHSPAVRAVHSCRRLPLLLCISLGRGQFSYYLTASRCCLSFFLFP